MTKEPPYIVTNSSQTWKVVTHMEPAGTQEVQVPKTGSVTRSTFVQFKSLMFILEFLGMQQYTCIAYTYTYLNILYTNMYIYICMYVYVYVYVYIYMYVCICMYSR